MKRLNASILCLLMVSLCAGQVAERQPADDASLLPPLPTSEEILQLPANERLSARAAVKQVMVQRTLRQKVDGARLTSQNAADCLALGIQLQAPKPFVEMLRLEASGQLYGRDLYDYRQAFSSLVALYGIDALSIRLCTEGLPYSVEELRKVLEWLPLEHVFNLVPGDKLSEQKLTEQLSTLASIYKRMAEVYAGVTNREQADAAAEVLVDLLASFDSTSPVRLILAKQQDSSLLDSYRKLVHRDAPELAQHRVRLLEVDYFGSRKLALLDYLLN